MPRADVSGLAHCGTGRRQFVRGGAVADDGFVSAVDVAAAAAEEVHETVDSVVAMLRRAAAERASGAPVQAVSAGLMEQGRRPARLAPAIAFGRFEAAVTAHRARAIRRMIGDEGLPFAAVGRLTEVSRQTVARLDRSAETADRRLDATAGCSRTVDVRTQSR